MVSGLKLTSTYKYAKEAFLGNEAVEPLYYMDARYTGQTYAPEDFVVNSVVGLQLAQDSLELFCRY